jgi:cbb3-type cytochrome oxidase subunit 1/cbb3-type cytochrome oxidase cytochrome c subunit
VTTDTAIAAPEESADFSPSSDADAAAYIKTSLAFLAVSLLVGLVVAVQLVAPSFLAGVSALSYGRLQPAFTHLFISGWMTIGLIGALLFVVPRATRTEPRAGRNASLAGVSLLTVGVLAGTVGILFGFSEGRRYLDAPLWADVIVLLGLLAAAQPVISVVRAGDERDLGVVQWYAGGGFTWLILTHVVGNVPGLTGTAVHLQTAFYRSSLIGLWLGAAGVAAVFYLAPRLTGRSAAKGTRLSVLGFWSLAFVWAMTSPAELTFTAVGDWVETIGIVFAISMIVPVLVIFADLVVAVRGRLDEVTERITLRFVFAGAVAFALVPVFTLAHAFRSSSAVLLFTDWIAATELLVFGAVTLWLMAVIRFAAAADDGLLSRLHYLGTVTGLVTAVGAGAFAGVQIGFEWAGAANSRVFANAGDGFINTLRAAEGPRIVFLVGFAVFALAQMLALGGLRRSDFRRAEPELVPADEPELDLAPVRKIGVNKLRLGASGLFGAALLLVVVLPAFESDQREPTILADFSRNYDAGTPAADGREIYISEGCQACHTQMVRANITDVGLGAVSVGGDYVREVPPVIGWHRIGPDLMHVGLRTTDDAVVAELEARGAVALEDLTADERLEVLRLAESQARDALRSHLADPRSMRPWSTMPSYDHLSDADLDRLTEYLLSLK